MFKSVKSSDQADAFSHEGKEIAVLRNSGFG
jgi:hypothetical protein